MSFLPYPRYKPSGVAWLGDVPEHWKIQSLRRVVVSYCDGPFGSGLKSDHYVDEGVRVIRLQNIRQGRFDGHDAAFIDADYYQKSLGDHDVVAGDLLFAGLGDDNNTVGRACVAPAGIEPAMVKADCFRFRLSTNQASPEFLAAQLTSGAPCDAGTLSSGSTRSRIPLSQMASRRVALPPLDEQIKVAIFLDRETAKIDALVEEQKRLIDLLKEKRQAVITQAVTKGLNPNAPMKPSGIEWLGDVPAHWEVTRVKALASMISKGTTPTTIGAEFTDEGVRFIKAENISDGIVTREPEFFVTEETDTLLKRSSLQENDVLVVIAGATTGKSAVMNADLLPANTNQAVCFVRCLDPVGARFMQLWMSTNLVQRVIALSSVQSAQPNLSMEELGNVAIPLAPLSERLEIIRVLEAECYRIDELIRSSSSATMLLQERRRALLSAAVTGKIDVRGFVPASAVDQAEPKRTRVNA